MFESLGRSWNLAMESFRVLRQHRSLIAFPVVSFFAGVVLAIFIGVTLLGLGWAGNEGVTLPGVLAIFLFYLGSYFVTIYFQVALVAAVKLHLAGGKPTLGYGVMEANKRLGAIASWAFIAAVVGMLLRALEEIARRNNSQWGRLLGGILVSLVGAAWSLATFFVIPVLAYEGVGGFGALKRSVSVVSRRWGEAVVGQAGIMLVVWILGLAIAIVLGFIAFSLIGAGGAAMVLGVGVLLGGLAAILLVVAGGSAMESIYVAVLYEYATQGKVAAFDHGTLDEAFRPAPRSLPSL